jgi:GH15 family glucan-1,4-alpha-glucosidase
VSRTLAYGGPVVDESYPPIEGYAVIGDCRSAALISKAGSLDWLCLPRFDSPSRFGALLDREKGGHFTVRPTKPFTSERRYLQGTNVLETTFTTANGRVVLTDLMPVGSEADRRAELWPDRQVVRRVEGLEGEVEIEVVCDPRPEYGARLPRMEGRGSLGIYYNDGADVLVLRSEVPLTLSEDGAGARGRATLAPGERRWLSLVHSHGEPAVIPPFGEAADRKLAATIRWWSEWSGRCRYDGPYREAVVRSALTLKLMSYAPSGAIIAAPTTSLPEWIGSVRNWDYRYCWLRDASLTLQSLMGLGYREEAESFLSWMLHTTHLTWPELHVLYDVYGGTRLEERELSHLEGYAGSSPVRVGNGAADQLQLDVYGKVVDAAYQYLRRGGGVDRTTARMLVGWGKTVCRRWREPDEGIWEIRAGRRHHTYSKAMCWVALDRLIRLHEEGYLKAPVERFRQERDRIRTDVEANGYSDAVGSYVASYGGDSVDASLLLLPRFGYVEADSERMMKTCEAVQERLGVNGLLYRYRVEDSDVDGLPAGEGAFGICSFWAVDCLAMQGSVEAARRTFEKILAHANDVGLFAEEIDPQSGAALGNFPQAFTHVGLIDAALMLERAQEGRPIRSRALEGEGAPSGKAVRNDQGGARWT